MHDPTEGGILNGIHEMADAAGLGVHVFEEKITVEPETAKICRFYEIDPLQLISSGALLIAADPQAADKIVEPMQRAHLRRRYRRIQPKPKQTHYLCTQMTRRRCCQDQPQTTCGLRYHVNQRLKMIRCNFKPSKLIA